MKVIVGKHILIHQLNEFFSHVSIMLLEHFDSPEYSNVLFSLGTYIRNSSDELRLLFPNKKIIVYQLEQLMGLSTWQYVPRIINNIKNADEIWDYDHLNIAYLQEFNIHVHRLMPLLYSKNLERIDRKHNPDIDVLFYGLINERRFKIFQKLQANLYGKLKIAWVYGDFDMDKHIANTKVVLNLHASEPWNRQEQVRMFYPIINEVVNISEVSQHNNMPGEIIESSLNDLEETLKRACYSDEWKSFSLDAKEKFKIRSKRYLESEFGRQTFLF